MPLTPSESIFVSRQQECSKEALLVATLRTALLVNVEAHVIRLELREKPRGMLGTVQTLCAIPTGKEGDWPTPSLESRLHVAQPQEVSAVITEWLDQESSDAWKFGAEKYQITLVLRDLVKVRKGRFGRRRYTVPDSTLAAAKEMVPAVE